MNKKKSSPEELRFAILATDVVIFAINNKSLDVLLIDIDIPPHYKKMMGIPGGLINDDETAEESVMRHVNNKAKIDLSYIEQLYTFSSLDRDLRNRVVSVAYFAFVKPSDILKRDANVHWMDVRDLPELAFDHNEIIKKALDRVRGKFEYTTFVQGLLPDEFTLSELQVAYEIVLGREQDKRNFRKKILSLNCLEATGSKRVAGRSRPAELYRFISEPGQVLDII
ncbi:MAG: NUDIX domain-containing protein [Candidatus Pacebacteria bacterium]|nr:NUDIX domain-containing protein [Candidatus Paceibacterota bacterium]